MIRACRVRVQRDGVELLGGIDLILAAGERVLLVGRSGSGKSTLLRALSGLRSPDAGTIERAVRCGVVFQEPADQLVGATVGEELALCARAAGRAPEPATQLALVGLDVPAHADPGELSGGQQQRLAVAGCLAGGAPALLLDEPLAHLDPDGAASLLALLTRRAAAGDAVLLVEHRLELALPWATRVVVLERGRIVFDGPQPPSDLLTAQGLRVPAMARVGDAGGLDALGPRAPRRSAAARLEAASLPGGLPAGARLALMGCNGAGKSTLLARWARTAERRAVWVPQDPDLALCAPTVAGELAGASLERRGALLQAVGLDRAAERPPQALSRGERLRLAVAAALAAEPELLLLDEPTSGQHADAVDAVMGLADTQLGDRALVFATHDLELALRWADTVAIVSAGQVVALGPPGELLPERLPALAAAQRARGFPIVDTERQLTGPEAAASGASARHVPSEPLVVGRVERAPPTVASAAALLGVGSVAVLLDRPLLLGALAAASAVWFWTRPLALRLRWMVTAATLGVVWSTVLSQALFYGDRPRTALLVLGPITLWAEGVRWGLVQSARLVAVLFLGLGLSMTASSGRVVGLLRALYVPAALAFLASTALRFVPQAASEWARIRAAHTLRWGPSWWRGPWGALRVELTLLRPLIARGLRRALRLAESLDSRGIDPRDPPIDAVAWRRSDRVAVLGIGAGVGGVAALQLLHGLYLFELWYHPALRPLYAWVQAWL